MRNVSLFDVIGPCMVGPSSSHTAGACRMAAMARAIFGEEPGAVRFTLYGSFAETYRGHGSDKALLGGVMGFEADDPRIRDSFHLADEHGLRYAFVADATARVAHPNTVDIYLTNRAGDRTLDVLAVSVGGGRIKIVQLDGVDVNFTGEYPTLIIHHRNVPGVISYFTGILGDHQVNIANMRCYSEPDGANAYSVLESEQPISPEILGDITCNRHILKTMLIQA